MVEGNEHIYTVKTSLICTRTLNIITEHQHSQCFKISLLLSSGESIYTVTD